MVSHRLKGFRHARAIDPIENYQDNRKRTLGVKPLGRREANKNTGAFVKQPLPLITLMGYFTKSIGGTETNVYSE